VRVYMQTHPFLVSCRCNIEAIVQNMCCGFAGGSEMRQASRAAATLLSTLSCDRGSWHRCAGDSQAARWACARRAACAEGMGLPG